MLSMSSRNGYYQERKTAPGDLMSMDQLLRYRDVIFSAPDAKEPFIYARQPGAPFLSLEHHVDWITEKAAKLFERLYRDPPNAQKNPKDMLNGFNFCSSNKNSRGSEEWTNKSDGKFNTEVVSAYLNFCQNQILPPHMAQHPFFSPDNANNWVRDAPFALFEEYITWKHLNPLGLENRIRVFNSPSDLPERARSEYFRHRSVKGGFENRLIGPGVGLQNAGSGSSLIEIQNMDRTEALFEEFFRAHGRPEEHGL